MFHMFFIHAFVEGYLAACFPFLAIMNILPASLVEMACGFPGIFVGVGGWGKTVSERKEVLGWRSV